MTDQEQELQLAKTMYNYSLWLFMGALSVVAISAAATFMFLLTSVDTTDWFAPTLDAPVLEIGTNATGKTVNTQATVDGEELQGAEL